jgi:ATP-dependent DNA ligase
MLPKFAIGKHMGSSSMADETALSVKRYQDRAGLGMTAKSPTTWLSPPSGSGRASRRSSTSRRRVRRHEIKWDGYRISITVDEGKTKVRTRKGLDWTEKFPAIATDAAKLACRDATIDSEAVVLDAKGRPDFSALQAAIGEGGANIVAYAFDLLFLDGQDLRPRPLSERRQALQELIGKVNSENTERAYLVQHGTSRVP